MKGTCVMSRYLLKPQFQPPYANQWSSLIYSTLGVRLPASLSWQKVVNYDRCLYSLLNKKYNNSKCDQPTEYMDIVYSPVSCLQGFAIRLREEHWNPQKVRYSCRQQDRSWAPSWGSKKSVCLQDLIQSEHTQ